MSPLTLSRRCPLLLPTPPLRSLMSFPTARSSPLAMSVSAALRLSSSLPSLEWKPVSYGKRSAEAKPDPYYGYYGYGYPAYTYAYLGQTVKRAAILTSDNSEFYCKHNSSSIVILWGKNFLWDFV